MFAEERMDEIIKSLNHEGKVVVKDLSSKFEVTEDCIRKDLKNLEKKGMIKRTYGGAVLARQVASNNTIINRKNINIDAKRKIAQKAFDLIQDRETIFLDISTTNIILAELIANSEKKVKVVSNMIDVIKAFSNSVNQEVIGIGGLYSTDLDGFIGSSAIESISKYRFNKVFIGSCGVNLFEKSVTTFDVEDGNTKKAIINSGKKIYLVMESNKFYFDGVYKFAEIFDVDAIIVDKIPEQNISKVLKENSIELI